MSTTILVIDDDINICEMLRVYLENEGYEVKTANDGAEGISFFKIYEPDMVLLDIMLPKKDGWQVCREIREISSKPVIMITAKGDVFDKVLGLELGADDYIVKPFELQEFLARVETALRRYNLTEKIINIGEISIDTTSRTVTLKGKIVPLPLKEYELLLYLVKNKNIALYRESIYENVWKEPYYGNTRTIDLHIQRLKKKLDLGDAIEAVYKVGYKFNVEKLI